MRIDAHHHLWNYSAKQYDWINPNMEVLKHDFTPDDLVPLIKAGAIDTVDNIDGTVAVQARSTLEENDFLLAHSEQNPIIKAVVGWADLTHKQVVGVLARYSDHDTFKGIRHVLQAESDDAYCLRPDFNRGIALLHDFGLSYDILIFHRQLANSILMVDQHPDQIFILDHIAKPEIRSTSPDPTWVKNIQQLAERGQVFCKISGMVTEVSADIQWSPELLRPYFEIVLDAFGPDRLMFGSDWPVALLRSSYSRWVQTVTDFTSQLSTSEQAAIFGLTAARAYGIS